MLHSVECKRTVHHPRSSDSVDADNSVELNVLEALLSEGRCVVADFSIVNELDAYRDNIRLV